MKQVVLERVKIFVGEWSEWRVELENHWDQFWGVAPIALHPISLASKDEKLRELYREIDCVLPDSVWHRRVLRWKWGVESSSKFYGPELMRLVIKRVGQIKGRAILFGGRSKEHGTRLKQWSLWVGGRGLEVEILVPSKPVKEEEIEELVSLINKKGREKQVVFLGVGSPKQHELLLALKRRGVRCPVIAVGAAFDIWGGEVKMCPKLLRRLGGEWFWRWIQEPRRLTRRNWEVIKWLGKWWLSFGKD